MNLLATLVQGLARQRHPVLPTDQAAEAPESGGDGPQAGAISLPPDEAFGVGGHQLAVVVDQLPVRIKCQDAVVERAVAEAVIHAFVDADDEDDAQITRVAAEAFGFRTGDGDAVLRQAGIDFFGFGAIPLRDALDIIQPGGIARQPGFSQDDQLRAQLRGSLHPVQRQFQAGGKVVIDGPCLHDRRWYGRRWRGGAGGTHSRAAHLSATHLSATHLSGVMGVAMSSPSVRDCT